MAKGVGLLIMCCLPLSLHMQATAPAHVHTGYCSCTRRQATAPEHADCLWFSWFLCIGRRRSASGFFSNPPLVLERRPLSEPGAHQIQLNWLASKTSILLFLPPQCQDYRYVPLQRAFHVSAQERRQVLMIAQKVSYLLSLSVFLKKTFIFLSLLGFPNQKCPPQFNSG